MARRKKISEQDYFLLFVIALVVIAGFWNALKQGKLWAILVLFFIVISSSLLLYFWLKKRNPKRIKRINTSLDKIDKMTGYQFEEFIADLYESLGFKTILTPKTGDYGADVILEKDEIKTVVQVKNYKNPVGFGAIKEVQTAKIFYNADEAMVITNSKSFTPQATKSAKELRIKLISRKQLSDLLNRIK